MNDITTVQTDNDLDDYFSLYYLDLDKCGKELIRMDNFLIQGLERGCKLLEGFKKNNSSISVNQSLLDNLDEFTQWKENLCNIPLAFIDNPKSAKSVTTPYTQRTLYWSNLNIIAQKGCFLLYNHQENLPLEEYMDGHRYSKLGCLDVHKSLVDYVRANYLSGLTRETLFPNITRMARQAYIRFKEEL